MGSGRGSEGIRWSRYLPRALLTATRHRLSKVLGTPEMPWEEKETEGGRLTKGSLRWTDRTTLNARGQLPNFTVERAVPGEEGLVACSSLL